MQKFCYKCGALDKNKGPLIKGLCQDCFVKNHPLIKVPDKVNLSTCGKCGAYFLENEWHDPHKKDELDLLSASEKLVYSKIKVNQMERTGLKQIDIKNVKEINVKLDSELSPPDIKVKLSASGKIHEIQESPQKVEKTVKVNVKIITCDVCSRKAGGYYEAILQVRGDATISEETLIEIFNTLEKAYMNEESRNRNEFVTKIEKKHGGLDIYTSSTALARHLADILKEKYNANTDESSKLIGQTSDGREKYRVSIAARIP